MSFATLDQAAKIVAQAAGLCWPADRAKAVELTNKVRELLYERSTTQWGVNLCVPTRCFCDECANDCAGKPTRRRIVGITLPSWIENVQGVRWNKRPMIQTDRWAVYPSDNDDGGAPWFGAEALGEDWPLMNDPSTCGVFRMCFVASNPADYGKTVRVRHLDNNGIERDETILLSGNWTPTNYWTQRLERPGGIVLPSDLKGGVTVRDDRGLQLALYKPWETVPAYVRWALPGVDPKRNGFVEVKAYRRFIPLFDPTDVVETGTTTILENFTKHLILHGKTNADAADMQNSKRFFARGTEALEAELIRRRGVGQRLSINFVPQSPRQSGLRSKRFI